MPGWLEKCWLSAQSSGLEGAGRTCRCGGGPGGEKTGGGSVAAGEDQAAGKRLGRCSHESMTGDSAGGCAPFQAKPEAVAGPCRGSRRASTGADTGQRGRCRDGWRVTDREAALRAFPPARCCVPAGDARDATTGGSGAGEERLWGPGRKALTVKDKKAPWTSSATSTGLFLPDPLLRRFRGGPVGGQVFEGRIG